jgi:hypothetical protein
MARPHYKPGTHYARNRERILAARKQRYLQKRPCRECERCVVCGGAMPVSTRADAKYCSTLCRSRSRGPVEKAEYWRTYYTRHKDRLRSSRSERRAQHKTRPKPRACRQCSKIFTPKRDRAVFCSRTCIGQARVRQPEQENARRRAKSAQRRECIPVRQCAWCGRTYKPLRRSTSRWCSERCMADRWAKDHPDVRRAAKARRRARLCGVTTEHISPLEVFTRDNWTCRLCLKPTPQRLIGTRSPRRPTIDHILPVSKGGPHTYQNVQCACSQCNCRKSARIRGQFRLF